MGPFWQPICAVVDYRCSGAVQQSRPLRAVIAQFPDLGAWPPPNSLRNQKMVSRSAVLPPVARPRSLAVPAPAPPGGPGPEAGSPGSAPRGRGSAALKRPSTVAGRVHKSLNSRATGRSEGRRELSRRGAIVRSGLLASAALSAPSTTAGANAAPAPAPDIIGAAKTLVRRPLRHPAHERRGSAIPR